MNYRQKESSRASCGMITNYGREYGQRGVECGRGVGSGKQETLFSCVDRDRRDEACFFFSKAIKITIVIVFFFSLFCSSIENR